MFIGENCISVAEAAVSVPEEDFPSNGAQTKRFAGDRSRRQEWTEVCRIGQFHNAVARLHANQQESSESSVRGGGRSDGEVSKSSGFNGKGG
jgi:hypothetical protein